MFLKIDKLQLAVLMAFVAVNSFALKSKPIFPIAIKDQISSADGVIIGTFQGSSNTKNKEGEVTTVGSFFVDQVAGIPASSILNRYSFRVEYPGGDWQGIKYKSKEAPKFTPGEKVVLILKKGKFGYELPYQALSKFNFDKREEGLVIYSRFFNDRRGVGFISWNEFNQIVEQHFGMRVGSYLNKTNGLQQGVASAGFVKARGPASVYSSKEIDTDYKIETYWLVFILGALGGVFSLFGKYREEPEQ